MGRRSNNGKVLPMTEWICLTCKERCHLKVRGRVDDMPDICPFSIMKEIDRQSEWNKVCK